MSVAVQVTVFEPTLLVSKAPQPCEAIPERLSVAPVLAVALPLSRAGFGETLEINVGTVLSILMPLAVASALTLPALSAQVPAADCPAPSLLNVTGVLQLAMPDRVSEPLKLTPTSVLFQPLALAPGVKLPKAIVGGVASRLMVTDLELVPPVLVAVQVKVVPVGEPSSESQLSQSGPQRTQDQRPQGNARLTPRRVT